MRQRDERFAGQARRRAQADVLYDKQPTGQPSPVRHFRPEDFHFHDDQRCICPAGKTLRSTGRIYLLANGLRREDFKARVEDCADCELRSRCLRHPERTPVRKVSRFHQRQVDRDDASECMHRAIDSPRGRALYSQRIGTVEPVFANLRHNKRLTRFTLRGRDKVNAQWHLYCLVHNIEKLAGSGWQV